MKKLNILDIKPTQFSLGMQEIIMKTKDLQSLKKKALKKHIQKNPIPIIISPKKRYYLIDHHHALYCYWQIGVKKVPVTVIADLSNAKLTHQEFWKKMIHEGWTYLYDQFGDGPRAPLYLPQDIRGMADDPYRSLAWLVRTAGGYKDSNKTYCEFMWADYFRKKQILHKEGRDALLFSVKQATKIAREKGAKKLPGYLGKKTALLRQK